MSYGIVWMDSEHAKIFAYVEGGVEKRHYDRHEPDHHTHSTHDVPKNSEHLYKHIATQVGSLDKVLIIGSRIAQDHFKKHLEVHHEKAVLAKIVGSETADHMSEPQIEAFGRKWFTEHDPLLK